MVSRALVLLLLLAMVACDATTRPERGIRFETSALEYSHGEIAEARLLNGSGTPIGYNFCLAMREVWTGSGWERIVPLHLCLASLETLEVGGEAVLRQEVESSWEPGRYRFVLRVGSVDSGPVFEVTSNVFLVTE